jgi:hypothetical protein
VDPTSLRGDKDVDSELSQELLTLRQRISGEVLELAAKHPNPSFGEDEEEEDDDEDEDEDVEQRQQGLEQQMKAASTALQAFPHLRALQSFVQELHKSTKALDFEDEEQQISHNGARDGESARPGPSMDDFWEVIAESSPGQRLLVLSELLAPQTMREFVVATDTFFHIRHLLADEDGSYMAIAEAHAFVSQLVLALEDSQPIYLPAIAKLLYMFAKHKPLRRLMLQKQTVQLIQTRKRALRDKSTINALDQLLRALTS